MDRQALASNQLHLAKSERRHNYRQVRDLRCALDRADLFSIGTVNRRPLDLVATNKADCFPLFRRPCRSPVHQAMDEILGCSIEGPIVSPARLVALSRLPFGTPPAADRLEDPLHGGRVTPICRPVLPSCRSTREGSCQLRSGLAKETTTCLTTSCCPPAKWQ
jgi:hypothetical protein